MVPDPSPAPTSNAFNTVSCARMHRALRSPAEFRALTGLHPAQAIVAFETDYRSDHLTGAARMAHSAQGRTGAWAWRRHHRGEMRGTIGLGFGILTQATALKAEARMHHIIASAQDAYARAQRSGRTLVLLLPLNGQARLIPRATWEALFPPAPDLLVYVPDTGEWTHDE